MKTRTTALFVSMLVLGLVVGIQTAQAQNAPAAAGQNQPVLTGSGVKIEDVSLKADAIFIGEITAIGFGDAKAKGESAFHGVRVKVLQVLRGTVDPDITVTLHLIGTMSFHQDPPKVGSSYIFFVSRDAIGQPDPYTVLKLLPATDDTTTAVKKLIPAAPASK